MRRLPICIRANLELEIFLLYEAERHALVVFALIFAAHGCLRQGALGELLIRLGRRRCQQLHIAMIRRGCIKLRDGGLGSFAICIIGPFVE
jgi:hypothetical protein